MRRHGALNTVTHTTTARFLLQADSSSWLFWIKFFGLANNTNSL